MYIPVLLLLDIVTVYEYNLRLIILTVLIVGVVNGETTSVPTAVFVNISPTTDIIAPLSSGGRIVLLVIILLTFSRVNPTIEYFVKK